MFHYLFSSDYYKNVELFKWMSEFLVSFLKKKKKSKQLLAQAQWSINNKSTRTTTTCWPTLKEYRKKHLNTLQVAALLRPWSIISCLVCVRVYSPFSCSGFIALLWSGLLKFMFILVLILFHFPNRWGFEARRRKAVSAPFLISLQLQRRPRHHDAKAIGLVQSLFIWCRFEKKKTSERFGMPLIIIVFMNQHRSDTCTHKKQPQQK